MGEAGDSENLVEGGTGREEEEEEEEDEYESDYELDLGAFGVDDPAISESAWLKRQGFDPEVGAARPDGGSLDEREEEDEENEAAPAVLSLAEVGYSRDLDSINKAQKEKRLHAVNDKRGATERGRGNASGRGERGRGGSRGGARGGRSRGRVRGRNKKEGSSATNKGGGRAKSSSKGGVEVLPRAFIPDGCSDGTLNPNARSFEPTFTT